VHRSGIARSAFQGPRETGRPLEAVGTGAEPDRLEAVVALVVGELARSWTRQRRKPGPSSRNGAVLQPTSDERRWKP